MTRYAIAMGSNLGDRIAHLRSGLDGLGAICRLVSVSPIYETAPVGGPEQGPYLNAVAVVDTDLDPHELLRALQGVEASRGRERGEVWGPRTLDLDLIATDHGPVDDPPLLIVPHPRAAERRFVVEPLQSVWPDADLGGVTASEALMDVSGQDVEFLARNWHEPWGSGAGWVAGQLLLFALIGLAVVWQGSLPQAGLGAGQWIGAVVAAAGIALTIWSAVSLGPGLTATPEPVSAGSLVAHGPYAWVRHPMYTSVVMLFAGVAIFFEAPVAGGLAAMLLGYFFLKSRTEERRLRVAYPAYREYRSKVRNRFFPLVF